MGACAVVWVRACMQLESAKVDVGTEWDGCHTGWRVFSSCCSYYLSIVVDLENRVVDNKKNQKSKIKTLLWSDLFGNLEFCFLLFLACGCGVCLLLLLLFYLRAAVCVCVCVDWCMALEVTVTLGKCKYMHVAIWH